MASFTPQQIEQFLREFFDVVGTRQYTGARYVPIFGRKNESSIAWNNSSPYEPLTIVLHQGNSYTSRTYVPAGVDILDTHYWANTGNYNAQIEQYRQEVLDVVDQMANLDDQVTAAISMLDNPDIIIIGDSWSDTRPEATSYIKWPVYFNGYIQCSLHNYARNGSSISGDTPVWAENGNFLGQVNAAIADTSFDHDNCKLIIIFGGVNDYRGGNVDTNVGAALRSHVVRLRSEFTNARVVGFVNHQRMVNRRQWTYIQYLIVKMRSELGINFYSTCGWLIGAHYISDNVHPNDDGYRSIAANVIACCFGGVPEFRVNRYTINGTDMDFTVEEIWSNTSAKLQITATTKSNGDKSETFNVDQTSSAIFAMRTFGTGAIILESTNLTYYRLACLYLTSATELDKGMCPGYTINISTGDLQSTYFVTTYEILGQVGN